MTSGILVDKETREKVLGFKDIQEYSVEEIIENNGLNPNELEFIHNSDLDIDVMDTQDWHKVNSDGSVEDIREVVGYKVRLSEKVDLPKEQAEVDKKTVRLDNEPDDTTKNELEQKTGMEVIRVEEKLR